MENLANFKHHRNNEGSEGISSLPTLLRANVTQFPMIHKKCFDVGGQV